MNTENYQDCLKLQTLYFLRVHYVYLRFLGKNYKHVLLRIRKDRPISSITTIVKLFYENMFEEQKIIELHEYVNFPVNTSRFEISEAIKDINNLYKSIM